MIVLALDTALDACSVAVVHGAEVLARSVEPMERGHQERLAPMTSAAMAEAGLPFSALHRIAVTVGPGSFTGLRVGLAFAKSMALALAVPCVGVGTLEALAASAPARPVEVAAVLDARRGGVYLQAFRDGAPADAPANLPAADALAYLDRLGFGEAAVLVGSGAALLRGGAAATTTIDPVSLARLAQDRAAPQAMPAPLYLRAPDARTLAERTAERAVAPP